jgi:hypothetical protein
MNNKICNKPGYSRLTLHFNDELDIPKLLDTESTCNRSVEKQLTPRPRRKYEFEASC